MLLAACICQDTKYVITFYLTVLANEGEDPSKGRRLIAQRQRRRIMRATLLMVFDPARLLDGA
jgi:hypothetical protein